MNPYKLTGNREGDHLCHGTASMASPAALTMAAISPEYGSPAHAAEAALDQLSSELMCLAELLSGGTDLNSEFIVSWVRGMASRADVAVELSSRVRAANRASLPAENGAS
jgi:hypothetical protein